MGRAGHRRARQLFSYKHHVELLEQALLEAAGSEEPEPVPDPSLIAPNVLEVETDEIVLRDK